MNDSERPTPIAMYAFQRRRPVLGGCSYADEADFVKGDYYHNMRQEALADLQRGIQATYDELEELRPRCC